MYAAQWKNHLPNFKITYSSTKKTSWHGRTREEALQDHNLQVKYRLTQLFYKTLKISEGTLTHSMTSNVCCFFPFRISKQCSAEYLYWRCCEEEEEKRKTPGSSLKSRKACLKHNVPEVFAAEPRPLRTYLETALTEHDNRK